MTDIDPVAPLPARRPAPTWKRALQLLGFLAGLALLGWCIAEAFKPENREQLQRLADAPAWKLALLFALNLAYIALNAQLLWATIRPVRRVPTRSVQAVHAVCVLLSYLPFKLSVLFRLVAHYRRDGVPLLTTGAWLAASGGATLGVVGALAAASAVRGRIDALWFLFAALALLAYFAFALSLCRVCAGPRGIDRAARLTERLGLGVLTRAVRSRRFAELHEIFAMQAHPGWFGLTIAFRLADLVVQSARFALAASIVGVPIDAQGAFVMAVTFFLIGVLSPAGALGTREAGTAALLGLQAAQDTAGGANAFVVVALAVSASESIATLAAAGVGIAILRPDRLLAKRAGPAPDHHSPA